MSSNLKQQQQNQFPMNRGPYQTVYTIPKPQPQRNTYPMMMGPYPFPSNMQKLLYTKSQAPRSFLQNFNQHHGLNREESGFKGDFRAQQKKQLPQNRGEGSYLNRKKENVIQIDDDDEKEEHKAQKQFIQKSTVTKQIIKTKQSSSIQKPPTPSHRPQYPFHKPFTSKPYPNPNLFTYHTNNFPHYPYVQDQRLMLLNHGLYSGGYGKVGYSQGREQFGERGYGGVGEGYGRNGQGGGQQAYFSGVYMQQQNSMKDAQGQGGVIKGNQIHHTHPPPHPQPPKPIQPLLKPPTPAPTTPSQPLNKEPPFLKKKKPEPEIIELLDSDSQPAIKPHQLQQHNGKQRYGKVFREAFYEGLYKTKKINKVSRQGGNLKSELSNDKEIMLERLQDLKKMKLSRQAQQNGFHSFIKLTPTTPPPPTPKPPPVTNLRTLLTLLSSDPAIMDIQQMKMLQQLYNNSNTNSDQYKSIIESFNSKALLNTTTKLLSEVSPFPSSYNSTLNKVTVCQSVFAENKDVSGSEHVKREAHRAFLKTRSRFMNNAGGKHHREPFTRTILSEPKPQQKRKPTSERQQQQHSTMESDAINLVSGKSDDKSLAAFQWTPRLKKLRDVSRRRQYDNVILLGPQFQAQLPRFISDPSQIHQLIALKRSRLLQRLFKSTL